MDSYFIHEQVQGGFNALTSNPHEIITATCPSPPAR